MLHGLGKLPFPGPQFPLARNEEGTWTVSLFLGVLRMEEESYQALQMLGIHGFSQKKGVLGRG